MTPITEVEISVPSAADVVEFNGWVGKLRGLGIKCLYSVYSQYHKSCSKLVSDS